MLNLLKSKPLIDQASAEWIFETYAWALNNFDSQEFFSRSRLVQPTNDFFPGRATSQYSLAEQIFHHTLKYMGLTHWPIQLQAPHQFLNLPNQTIDIVHFERHSGTQLLPEISHQPPIYLTYNSQQTSKPEDLSSSFAHNIAQHVIFQSQQLPPGGPDYFFEAAEILAIFMGFGVMFANSAYTFRGGCGSCYNPQANRKATLSENNVLFALALFCCLKDIPKNEASRFLKKHLRSPFKKAMQQIHQQPTQLALLLQFKPC